MWPGVWPGTCRIVPGFFIGIAINLGKWPDRADGDVTRSNPCRAAHRDVTETGNPQFRVLLHRQRAQLNVLKIVVFATKAEALARKQSLNDFDTFIHAFAA